MDKRLCALQALMDEYERSIQKVVAGLRIGDGILGMGRDPRREPCHMEFYEGVGSTVHELVKEAVSSQDVVRVAKFLIALGRESQYSELTRPMREAVQGHIQMLVPLLSPEDARELAHQYAGQYGRCQRLPVQKQLLRQLEQRGGGHR